MPRAARKRKICSCCDVPPPSMTSSQPNNVTKRRKVNSSAKEPINQSNQLVPSKIFDREIEESNENIVFESAGHSTRRVRNRQCQTIRGREFVHTFIKEVTYTVATTKLGYVGQELLPFHKRPNFFQKSPSAMSHADASFTQLNSASDVYVNDNDFKDSDSSFDEDNGGDYESSSLADDKFNESGSSFDEDNDSESIGAFEKQSADDDEFNDSDSFSDARSDAGSGHRSEDENYSSDNDSSVSYPESDDESGCFSKFGVRCQWHSRIREHWCGRRTCEFECRPVPAPCPKELEILQEAFQLQSKEKKGYAILQEVNLGYDDCSPCVYLYSNELLTICNRQQSNLRLDRTINLGHCYVTIFVFRHANLIDNSKLKTQYGPIMTGPVMIHFDKSLETYLRFFETVSDKCGIPQKPMTDNAILDFSNVPKKDKGLTIAMRLGFGSNMKLSNNHILPTILRTSLKKEFGCYSPVVDVVETGKCPKNVMKQNVRFSASDANGNLLNVLKSTLRSGPQIQLVFSYRNLTSFIPNASENCDTDIRFEHMLHTATDGS